jgi:hypothetical protein
MKRSRILLIAAAALAATSGPLLAHHANSAYDRDATISVTGTVIKWQFINPHAGLWLNVTDEQGNSQEWSGEFQGVLDLYRHFSWNKDTFKPGDKITITGNPSRDGAQSIATISVTFADGNTVNVRNAPD